MGNFQLLSREQEVEIAKRIEAGENEVEEEVLNSPVTLDFLIELGDRIEAGEADLRDIFEETEEPPDPDEERGPEANEKQLKKLHDSTKKLEGPAQQARGVGRGIARAARAATQAQARASYVRHAQSGSRATFTTMGLSRHVREAVISEMRHLLERVPPGPSDRSALRGRHRPLQDPANQRSGRGRRSPPRAQGQRHPRKPARHRRAHPRGAAHHEGGRAAGQGQRRRLRAVRSRPSPPARTRAGAPRRN